MNMEWFKKLSLNKFLLPVFLVLLSLPIIHAASNTPLAPKKITSVYTSVSKNDCQQLILDSETDSTIWQCKGISDYSLKILSDDSRESINVISPDKKEFPLNYWHVITPYFSFLGKKAEWRIINDKNQVKPIALIIRVHSNEQKNVDAKIKKTSYLAVTKITPTNICVTDKILPSSNANIQARIAADNSANKPCIQ